MQEVAGSIPGQKAKTPHAKWPKKQNIKQKQCCNKLKTLKMIFIKTKQKNLKKKKQKKIEKVYQLNATHGSLWDFNPNKLILKTHIWDRWENLNPDCILTMLFSR